jgi:hypothetical protein
MFVHTPTKSLVLKSRDPQKIIDTLGAANAKPLTHPQGNVQVRHNIDTVRILRNMGIEAPSPIWSDYDWPGKYTPFDHQRVMADVMSVHPRCFNLSEMGCVSGDTEYLGPEGWRRIDGYNGGKVAQYLPDTGEIEMVQPKEFVRKPCEDMIRLETTRGISQVLSPEHRVLLADGSVVRADYIAAQWGTQSLENRRFRFRTTFTVKDQPGIPMSPAEIKLHVAVSADAWIDKQGKAVMRLKRPEKIARLRELLRDACVEFTDRPAKPDGFRRFRFIPPMGKGFGIQWWACAQAQLEIVADEAPHWDGSKRKADAVGFCGIKRDADFVQYAFSATGRRASITQDARSYVYGAQNSVHASAGDPTVGLVQRNTARGPNVTWVKSPDGFKYCFMVPSTFLILRHNNCIFATGNTGKTYAALWAADYLMKIGAVKKAAILTPLSTMHSVWEQDIFKILMHRRGVVVHGTREQRMKKLDMDVDFYIINHDGVSLEAVAKVLKKRKDIDLIILDEASEFRNHATNKYRYLRWVLEKQNKRFWCMTGTPTPTQPDDAWAICRLIAPENVPQHKGEFTRQTMVPVTSFKSVPRQGFEQIVYDAMQPAVRFEKKNCLTLPPVTVVSRQTKMSREQQKMFDEMLDEMTAEAKSGVEITAVHAADKIGKLRQILCGCVMDTTNDASVTLDNGPRLADLITAIHEAQSKVLVIVPFKPTLRLLQAQLTKAGINMGVLNGDVSVAQRRTIIQDFKSKPKDEMAGLLCHPRVMAHGLNLTEADMLIFYAPIYSYDQYAQVIERFNRTGQMLKMTVLRMGAHAVEWAIYRTLDERGATQRTILDLYDEVTIRKAA